MPIYEYCCEKCGKEFEAWQRMSDDPIEKCSMCGGRARKLISQSTFVLKGSGWYVTDYGKSSSCASSSSAGKSSGSSSSESSSAASSDSSSATKSTSEA
jgi:putative FmdB family regulatory protein